MFLGCAQEGPYHRHYKAPDQALREIGHLAEMVGTLVGWIVWSERGSLHDRSENSMPRLDHLQN